MSSADAPRGIAAPPWIALSWVALALERLARVAWPALALTGCALALMLSGLLPHLPGWLHLGVLILGASLIVGAAVRGGRRWRRPTRAEAVRRLEGGPGQAHRPLTAAGDRLGLGADDSLSRALWRRHQATMTARARALRPRLPDPRLAGPDPRALRIVPLVLLFAALMAAAPDPLARLAAALSPRLGPSIPSAVAQLWITPPTYTGRAPVYIETTSDPSSEAVAAGASGSDARAPVSATPLTVPAGSTVLALVRGGSGPATLSFGSDHAPAPLDPTGEGGQRREQAVTSGTQLRLTQDGTTLIDRPMAVAPDRPPRVAWRALPESDSRGHLRLEYRATDDHGVTDLVAAIRPTGGQALGDPIDVALTPPVATPRAMTDRSADADAVDGARTETRDLSAHPWAGTPVTIQLKATDAAGQTGESETISLILPDRRFDHPVAQAVADLRRVLVTRPDRARAVANGLAALAADRTAYEDRLAIDLGLSAAAARLALDPEGMAQAADLDLLWSIALALEDGTLTLARHDVEQAREALRDSLERDAPRAEIQERLADLREALDRLMRELAESMPLATLPPMALPMPDGMEPFSPQDIDRLMDRLSELNDLGADEAARAMLDQLESMLRQLESARPPTAAEMQAIAEATEIMRRLQDLVQRQQALLDETFRTGPGAADRTPPDVLPIPDGPRPGESAQEWLERQFGADRTPTPPTPPSEAARALEERQRALREALEQMMGDLGEMTGQVPEALGQADIAMREAEEALGQGDTGAAARAQGRALDALTQGQGQAMGQMMGPGGPGGLFGFMPGGPGRPGPMGPGFRPGPGRDPFNRPAGSGTDDSVDVPSEPDTRRAHEILRELRRRANEPDRPEPEKNYLDRLMTPF
ncbi:TIGR02302 family protein [Roseospira marina]|uniref:TIGR02302 family protein n=1 Tax=Roseospira marina TaxID=140057 RepID=UPI0014797097|nr:TIGR02302 family protein [Roseospira marina]MBB4314893.1 uncharacterized protein (TIGR02302 family) [Roseospira marina]MBB5087893.1 uncharacterized protein (TIGR02302 family) [Roseospira marina]